MAPCFRTFHLLAALLVCAILSPAQRPTVLQTSTAKADSSAPIAFGQSMIPLNGPWKFQTGDSPIDPKTGRPVWAEPAFDDSTWQIVHLSPTPGLTDPLSGDPRYVTGWTSKGHPGYWGYAWYRIRVPLLTAPGEQLALSTMGHADDAFQFFDDGRLVGSWGKFRGPGEWPVYYLPQPTLFLLPSPSLPRTGPGRAGAGPAEKVLAFRFWMGRADLQRFPFAGGFHYAPMLGDAAGISALVQFNHLDQDLRFSFMTFEIVVFLLLAIVTASLTFFDRTDRVYVWIAGAFLFYSLQLGNHAVAVFTQLESARTFFTIYQIVGNPLLVGGWAIVWWVWFHLRRPAWVPRAILLLTFANMASMALVQNLISETLSQQIEAAFLGISIAVRLLLAALLGFIVSKGIRETGREGWLVLPAVIPIALTQFQDELITLHVAGVWHFLGNTFFFSDVAQLLMTVSVSLLLLRRLLLSIQRQKQMALDVKQAQEVQQVIMPEARLVFPGLVIESEYRPAREVGGDFFQIIPHKSDGSLLIVAGDVAGKGLQAGMLVALLVGAVRMAAELNDDPEFILQALNRRLLGRADAASTCLALRIDAGGGTILANAGHPAPYLNGEPLEMEGALPLGILDGAEPSLVRFKLKDGDKLILMSDGIVEATDANGQLLGFERVHNLLRTVQSASEVAGAALAFGQEDDISVISVTRTHVLEPVLASENQRDAWTTAKPSITN